MLSIGAMAVGQGGYYLDLAREDYYFEGGEPAGKWLGKGAEKLGLTGVVEREHLERLLSGYAPDGRALVQNAGRADRQPGWDLCFSAPKSVSVLWSQSSQDVRQAIQEAHHGAVESAVALLETEIVKSRRGKDGLLREPARIFFATFEHGTSRALDPQLHTHSLLVNLAVRDDETTGTIVSRPVYLNKMLVGAYYRNELAFSLQQLGYDIEREKGLFELSCVPKALMKLFSKRRAAIEQKLKDKGLETASAAAFATFSTRPEKNGVPPRGKLFEEWQELARDHGFKFQGQARPYTPRSDKAKERTIARLVREAADDITKSACLFTEPQLIRRALELSPGRGMSSGEICAGVRFQLGREPEIELLGEHLNENRYTTRRVARTERQFAIDARALAWSKRDGVANKHVDAVLRNYTSESLPVFQEVVHRSREFSFSIKEELKHHAKQLTRAARKQWTEPIDRSRFARPRLADPHSEHTTRAGKVVSAVAGELKHQANQLLRAAQRDSTRRRPLVKPKVNRPFKLSPEQAAAVKKITSMHGSLKILTGLAGTGKTAALHACREIWERAGFKVIGVAVAGKAARELHRGSGIESDTLAMLEKRMNPGFGYSVKHHAKQMVRAARKRKTYPLKPLTFDKNTVLVVDEASMVSLPAMAKLLKAVRRGGGQILAVGEHGQLPAIESVSPFRAMVESFSHAQLDTIIRQRELPDREAVRTMSSGDAKTLLDDFAKRGRLHVSETLDDAQTRLVKKWAEIGLSNPERSLIFCGTNEDANKLNRACQDERISAGRLKASKSITTEAGRICEGDRVLIRKKSRTLGIENGDIGTVTGVSSVTRRIKVSFDDGRKASIPLRSFKHTQGPDKGKLALGLGYAVTTHKGQGTTVDYGFVLLGGPMQDRETSYVQVSRAKLETHLFVDAERAGKEHRNLIQRMEISREKLIARQVRFAAEQERLREMERQRQR